MTYEQWWCEFVAEHEDWKYADSDALRKAAFKGGQESLRQQLSELKGMREEVVHYQKEFHKTRDQLAAAQDALENEQAKGIHSCHANCMMEGCVNRKLREQLFEARAECKILNNRLNNSKKYRARLEAAVNALIMASEEYDFDDGLGRGAPQQYWDALDPEVET